MNVLDMLKRPPNSNELASVQELSDRTGLTLHQINDYISRDFLLVARRKGRTRLLKDPPAGKVCRVIQAYLDEYGNLNRCGEHLRGRFPGYYRHNRALSGEER